MEVADFFGGEIVPELLKQLVKVSKKCTLCKSSAQQLAADINQLLPIIREIQGIGVELPQARQQQIQRLAETLRSGLELSAKVLLSNRFNVYKNLQYARKMEKLEKNVSRFINGPLQAHLLADVHHARVGIDRLLDLQDKLGGLTIGVATTTRGDGWIEEEMKRKVEEEEKERGDLVNLVGIGMVLAKKEVKEMLVGTEENKVIGICGIGGSGKTTLAREISRDPLVRSHYDNRVIFITVSQSPDVEHLKQKILAQIVCSNVVASNYLISSGQLQHSFGTGGGRSLVILDDVWSLSDLQRLICNIPRCRTLVVSRFRFPTAVNSIYEVKLLGEDEALSLFCYSAFGQKSIPLSADTKLVHQVVKECKGLPLALKVIGATLRDQPPMFWAGARNRLSRGESICDSHEIELLDRMAISIVYLPPKVKECFLDLASFPEDKKIPLDVLINMWIEIHDLDKEEVFAILFELSNKNLITLVKDAGAAWDVCSSYFEISVTVHDVLRDVALRLNNRDSLNERRRLLMPKREDRLPKEWERNMEKPFHAQIVSIHTGEMTELDWFSMDFPKAEVLILNFSSSEYYLPPFIDRMPKLRALILINYGNSDAILHNLSVFSSMGNLRSLWLEKVTVPAVPETTVPLRNLHKISLVLCEFDSRFGRSMLDDPIMLPCLLELTMDHCVSLTEFPSSICKISSLISLSITNCHDLHGLPPELGKLHLLQNLRISACPALEKLPESICALKRLNHLDVSQCVNLRSLPECLGWLINLERIDMRECSQIRNLPASVDALRRLQRVICDEEASWLWREVERRLPGLRVEVAEECFNLDWLSE